MAVVSIAIGGSNVQPALVVHHHMVKLGRLFHLGLALGNSGFAEVGGRILLAEATVYLATAPKSNASYAALNKAMEDVKRTRNDPVLLHLRNPVTPLMKEMGYGREYRYAHSYPDHFAAQDNLPDNLKGRIYYQPSEQGYEKEVAERLRRWWGERKGREDGGGEPQAE